jgi:hypothetical protein
VTFGSVKIEEIQNLVQGLQAKLGEVKSFTSHGTHVQKQLCSEFQERGELKENK